MQTTASVNVHRALEHFKHCDSATRLTTAVDITVHWIANGDDDDRAMIVRGLADLPLGLYHRIVTALDRKARRCHKDALKMGLTSHSTGSRIADVVAQVDAEVAKRVAAQQAFASKRRNV